MLFILDTSGSMSAIVSGTGKDRLDNMKDALDQILDGVNNVNVGLMRFSDPGGPILFPVSYIDEDVTAIEDPGAASMDVNVRIDQSSDDAEEGSTGSVDLTSPVLDLLDTSGSAGAGVDLEIRVSQSSDDAEEYVSNASVTVTGNNYGMAYDDSQQQIVGVRFQNVAVPLGATILSAELEFVAKESDSDTGFTLRIQGEDADDAPTFASTNASVSDGSRTGALVDWAGPDAWTTNNTYVTPDISTLVKEIVDRPGWTSGNSMAFTIVNAPSSTGSNAKRRVSYTYNSDPSRAPLLRISYATPGGSDIQTLGLRFRDVAIPQGATIVQAVIELRPNAAHSDPAEFVIAGQASDDPATFATTANNISSTGVRPHTAATVDWSAPAWSTATAEQTPDLTAIVQEIVDRPGWCGSNSMAFIIEPKLDAGLNPIGPGPRLADAYDSNPTNAPILRVDFDEENVPAGACIEQWVQRQVSTDDDDVEETLGSGSMNLGSNDLDMESGKASGMRFLDIPLNQGQQILAAKLTFTARRNDTGSTTLRFAGEDEDDAAQFANVQDNLSARTQTSATVSWSPTDWTQDETYDSADLTAIIQEIVDRPSWAPGNAMVLVQEHTSGPNRRARTYDDDALQAPILHIKVSGQLGTGGSGVKTVRTALKELIDDLDHKGHTPIVDTLYESARYYRGEDLHWGKMRGYERDGTYNPDPNASSTNTAVRQNTRVSHSASYSGGTVVRDPGCTDANLNANACITEVIDDDPTYDTPIETECQSNYTILLTDGQANHNHSEDLIKTMAGVGSCTEGNSSENCGRDLVAYLHDVDQHTTLDGDQTIVTYTIGFNFSSQWLKDLAADGGGSFHEASTASELADEITAIFTDILNRTTSFSTPSLSVNAFNKLFHGEDVYFSLFKPESAVRWDGNVKKYKLCADSAQGCTLGEVLDANDVTAIEDDPQSGDFGRIVDTALSFWSDLPDGAEIKEGGAGMEVPDPASRTVFAYTDTADPSLTNLDIDLHKLLDADSDGIFDGLTGTTTQNRERTQDLLGDPAHTTSDADRADLIAWIRGEDVDGVEDVEELSTAGRRYTFTDALHSSSVAITYGGDATDPVIKLIVGTNGGGLQMVNAHNGIEEWILYPQETLQYQSELRDNFNGDHQRPRQRRGD